MSDEEKACPHLYACQITYMSSSDVNCPIELDKREGSEYFARGTVCFGSDFIAINSSQKTSKEHQQSKHLKMSSVVSYRILLKL